MTAILANVGDGPPGLYAELSETRPIRQLARPETAVCTLVPIPFAPTYTTSPNSKVNPSTISTSKRPENWTAPSVEIGMAAAVIPIALALVSLVLSAKSTIPSPVIRTIRPIARFDPASC